MKNKYRLTDYFMGMRKDDIVELNEEEARMLKKIIIRYYSKKEIHDIVRDRITDKLKDIIQDIENGKYQKVMKDLSESPAGDGWGKDNRYIDFSHVANDLISNHIDDIGTALEFLEELDESKQQKEIIEKRIKELI